MQLCFYVCTDKNGVEGLIFLGISVITYLLVISMHLFSIQKTSNKEKVNRKDFKIQQPLQFTAWSFTKEI